MSNDVYCLCGSARLDIYKDENGYYLKCFVCEETYRLALTLENRLTFVKQMK